MINWITTNDIHTCFPISLITTHQKLTGCLLHFRGSSRMRFAAEVAQGSAGRSVPRLRTGSDSPQPVMPTPAMQSLLRKNQAQKKSVSFARIFALAAIHFANWLHLPDFFAMICKGVKEECLCCCPKTRQTTEGMFCLSKFLKNFVCKLQP